MVCNTGGYFCNTFEEAANSKHFLPIWGSMPFVNFFLSSDSIKVNL